MSSVDAYTEANSQQIAFINSSILQYARSRNYDFGELNRGNVSNLSKFISHRVILEYDLIDETLRRHEYAKVEKFIQEIFWRVYWKGWLELRPRVWHDFVNSESPVDHETLKKALAGRTGIECFDDWVSEIKQRNYLHNHTRMWFASIWIFTLKLPWQLGAKFFLEQLLDGDAASNTLSWRWVAGVQTKGKHYLARSSNIYKFSNARYPNTELNEVAPPIEESGDYDIQPNSLKTKEDQSNSQLLIFENDLHFKTREELYLKYSKIYLLNLGNKERKIPLSENVISFKNSLLFSFQTIFPNSEILVHDFEEIAMDLESIDVVYPFVGENLDYIQKLSVKHNFKISYLYRKEDNLCRAFCNKGFFNFKNNIPEILKLIR